MSDFSQIIEKIKPSMALILTLKDQKINGKGSGFVFSKKGLVITCNHVIVDTESIIKVKFPNDETLFDGRVVIRDEEHDLALIKIDDSTREPLGAADISEVKEGMSVLFSGYPLGLFNLTTHQGILSAILKDATGITTYLIDGTVNSGNSGCPLMTKDGKVIGVVNAKRREGSDILSKVEEMTPGAISLHGVDLVKIYNALIDNVQLGIGYAVPASYIPKHHDADITNLTDKL